MAFGNRVAFRLEGVANMLNTFKSMEKEVQDQIKATLQRELESWVVDAQMLTPVDTGALQESGRVLKPRGINNVRFEVVFGGVTRKGKFVNYAEEIHENHPTGAKFLEKVVEARSGQLENVIAKDLNVAINRVK